MAEKLIKCKKCGAEYPESWGECQCVTIAKGNTSEKAKEAPAKTEGKPGGEKPAGDKPKE